MNFIKPKQPGRASGWNKVNDDANYRNRYTHTTDWMFGCSDVRMFGCSDVRMFGCSDVRMFGCWYFFLRTDEIRTDPVS